MEQGEAQRLLAMESEMTKSVIGQKEAVSAICKEIGRAHV